MRTPGPFHSEKLNRELRELEIEASRSWSILAIGAALMFSVTAIAGAIFAAMSGS